MKTNKNSEVGRPKLPEGKKRTVRVFVSYTETEHEEVSLKASRNGLSLSAWIRWLSLNGDK